MYLRIYLSTHRPIDLSTPSADREADQTVDRLGDGADDWGEQGGPEDQQGQHQEDPVLLQEPDDVLARGWEQDRQQRRAVQWGDRQQVEHAEADVDADQVVQKCQGEVDIEGGIRG